MTDKKNKKTLKCRFCNLVIPPTSKGKHDWNALSGHVADKHKKESARIDEHTKSREEPPNLARSFVPAGVGTQGFGVEYRKTMGYKSGSPGAEQRKDSDDE